MAVRGAKAGEGGRLFDVVAEVLQKGAEDHWGGRYPSQWCSATHRHLPSFESFMPADR